MREITKEAVMNINKVDIHVKDINDFFLFAEENSLNLINLLLDEESLNVDTQKKIKKFIRRLKKEHIPFRINEKSFKRSALPIKKIEHVEDVPFGALYTLLTHGRNQANKKMVQAIVIAKLRRMLSNSRNILWGYMDDSERRLDFDSLFHCVELCKWTSGLSALEKERGLKEMIHACYRKRYLHYWQKKQLSPMDNKWSKLICVMVWMNLLKKTEVEAWKKKYAELSYDKTKPLFPQCWNRIWVFLRAFEIKNFSDLKRKPGFRFVKKRNFYSYKPSFIDVINQNYFHEETHIMVLKYMNICKFLELDVLKGFHLANNAELQTKQKKNSQHEGC